MAADASFSRHGRRNVALPHATRADAASGASSGLEQYLAAQLRAHGRAQRDRHAAASQEVGALVRSVCAMEAQVRRQAAAIVEAPISQTPEGASGARHTAAAATAAGAVEAASTAAAVASLCALLPPPIGAAAVPGGTRLDDSADAPSNVTPLRLHAHGSLVIDRAAVERAMESITAAAAPTGTSAEATHTVAVARAAFLEVLTGAPLANIIY
jgi:hypothetical protein